MCGAPAGERGELVAEAALPELTALCTRLKGHTSLLSVVENRNGQTRFAKDRCADILGFGGHWASLAAVQLCCCGV